MLTTYNLEDCAALKTVTEFLYATFPRESQPQKVCEKGSEIARVEEISTQSVRPDWGHMVFALPDFCYVNEHAYFDYQRDKVFVRTNKTLRKGRARETYQTLEEESPGQPGGRD